MIDNFVSEMNVEPEFRYIPADNLMDGDVVSENTVLFTIREKNTNTEFTLKAPCVGKVFFLVQIVGDKDGVFAGKEVDWQLDNSQISMAVIVPESWSKSQTVEWYRNRVQIEPYQIEDYSGADIENMLPNGALVLPNDIIYERNSIPHLAQKTGKIRYFQGCPNSTYQSNFGKPLAEIY